MFERYIKEKIQSLINSEDNPTFSMTGLSLEDSHVVPEVEPPLPPEEKAETILSLMTLAEKAEMLGGIDNLSIKGNERLKLPRVWCSDASAGVRCFRRATAFPVPIAQAATWNKNLVFRTGKVIGEECRAKGVSILLGPGVNIYRVPTCGRNFEYMGEDPYLAGHMAAPYIKGVQSRGVITTVKHFACNNSDYDRHRMNSVVDERTLQEIYLPAFKTAVQEGGSKSVMCAYNPVNGTWASENRHLLTEILREQWGFDGFVISDWISLYSTDGPLKAGLDLEMPKGVYLNPKKIGNEINRGTISEADVNRAVFNLLKTFFEMGIYSRHLKDHEYSEYSDQHSTVSLNVAREAIVLLKNEQNLLPLDKNALKRMAVVGKMAQGTTTCGGGSCCIKSHDPVSILQGILDEVGTDVDVHYIEAPANLLSTADAQTIRESDVVLACVGFTHLDESECYDKSWELPDRQGDLIGKLCRLNSNLVVTLTTGTGVETESWLSDAKALLHCFFLGERGGTAVSDILFGNYNPSGKLPFTMAKKWGDFASTHFYVKHQDKISLRRIIGPQGKPGFRRKWDLEYGEKLMVGYRRFDTHDIVPQFPFGFGLSYTTFAITDIDCTPDVITLSELESGRQLTVDVMVKNTGNRTGAEVVQLYVRDLESSLPRPYKELKGFQKVRLDPGESAEITFKIGKADLSFFNDTKMQWETEPGEFEIMTGNSSRNIHQKTVILLK